MRMHGTPEDWLAWLTGPDARKAKEASLILGGLDPSDEVDIAPLLTALSSVEREITFWSIVGLGRLGKRAASAMPELARVAAGHDQFGVRQAAVIALGKIGPDAGTAKAAVLRALDDLSPFVRRDALQALIDFEGLTDRDLERIEQMGKDPDEVVSNWSGIALRNIRLKGQPDA